MVGINHSLVALAVFTMINVCTACVTVFEEELFCIENGNFQMKCPVSHMIIIKEAVHRVVKSGSCPTDLDSVDACTLLNITAEVSSTCQKMNNCTVSVTDASTACSTYTGNKFVTVSYKCEPDFGTSAKAVSTAFCSNISWEGSYAYLNNLITPDDATRCLCTVTIPQDVNVLVKSLSLTTATDEKCSLFVNMDEDGQMTDFCTAGELLCKDGGRQLNFEYIPKGQSMSILTISVSHNAQFKLLCKINPATTTTAATTISMPQTTTAATTESTTQTTTMHENPSTATTATTTKSTTTTTTRTPVTSTTTTPVTSTTTTPVTSTTTTTHVMSTTTTTTKSPITQTLPPKAPAITTGQGINATTATSETTSTKAPGSKALPQNENLPLAQNIVIGIGVVAVFLLVLVLIVACLICYRKNKRNKKSDVDPYYQSMDDPRRTSIFEDFSY